MPMCIARRLMLETITCVGISVLTFIVIRLPPGDFGVSMMWRRPVTEVIGDRLWLTMLVSVAALFLTWTILLIKGI